MMTGPSPFRVPPRKVAIFRALNLGDLLCTVPAWRALRRAFPDAHITLVGLDSGRPVVQRYGQYLDELVLFPGIPDFPEQTPQVEALPDFYARMRAQRYDVALQMHGSGGQSNQVVKQFGARAWAGFVPELAQQTPGQFFAWPHDQPEIHRYLSLLEHLGVEPDGDALEFPLSAEDRKEAAEAIAAFGMEPARTVFIHPGARLPSRRWPVSRFADVANWLADRGWRIAVTGAAEESSLVADLIARLHRPAVNLSGKTSLGGLAALLERSRLLICNDTGISHVAAALQVPSVVVASGSDVARWAPLNRQRHTVLHFDPTCRPCAHEVCPFDHECAKGVTVLDVVHHAQRQLSHRGKVWEASGKYGQ